MILQNIEKQFTVMQNMDQHLVMACLEIMIFVYLMKVIKTDSYTSFPCSFVDTTGSGKNTFTGAEYFTINEIKVYLVDEA
jgi:hypothetical protein